MFKGKSMFLFDNVENIESYEREDLINLSEKLAMVIFAFVLVLSLLVFYINDFIPNIKIITYQPLYFTLLSFVLFVKVSKVKLKILDLICSCCVVVIGIMSF